MAKGRRQLISGADLRVALKTPKEPSRICRGFYQVEEDLLYVPLHPPGTFYSYLDSEQLKFDIDNSGRLLFITVQTPRHAWNIVNQAEPPLVSEAADIRFLDFRDRLPPAILETPADHAWLHLTFDKDNHATPCRIAKDLIFEITEASTLASIWILAMEDDRAARGMAAWRKSNNDRH